MTIYGLIGKSLGHSFSQRYFKKKFETEGIVDHDYRLFELATIQEFAQLPQSDPNLRGFNVTIPYKEDVIPFMDDLDPIAKEIGAVNVIKIEADRRLVGYNSDYFGFRHSVEGWLKSETKQVKALVLGTGGAAKAVWTALEDMGIDYRKVSRTKEEQRLTYDQLKQEPQWINEFRLIVNTTPLGTFPKTEQAPDLEYSQIGDSHYLFDLIYNPERSLFLTRGLERGAKVKNGQEMLELQAEKSWEIWNS